MGVVDFSKVNTYIQKTSDDSFSVNGKIQSKLLMNIKIKKYLNLALENLLMFSYSS